MSDATETPTITPGGGAAEELDSVAVERAEVSAGGLLTRFLNSPQTSLLIAILIFGAVVAVRSPDFLTKTNIINLVRDGTFVFIIATTATFVLVGGGLDLSVGSVFAIGTIAVSDLLVHGVPTTLAIVGGVMFGVVAGLINSVVIVYGRIPPLIATLGMLYVGRGLVNIASGGNQYAPLPAGFIALGENSVVGIPLLIVYAVVIGLIAYFVLEHTRFGYNVRAIGGNREAARACGIRVNRITIVLYVASGASAALAGVLEASWLSSGQPSVGNGLELQVISATIIGGTSLFGGIGSMLGTALGALMIAVLANGLVLLSINPLWQDVVVGIVLVLAVGLDQLRRARMWRTRRT